MLYGRGADDLICVVAAIHPVGPEMDCFTDPNICGYGDMKVFLIVDSSKGGSRGSGR